MLEPGEDGSTLALSSTRSEALKGFVVRMGEHITKGDVIVKLSGLGNTRKGYTIKISESGLVLEQVPTLAPVIT